MLYEFLLYKKVNQLYIYSLFLILFLKLIFIEI